MKILTKLIVEDIGFQGELWKLRNPLSVYLPDFDGTLIVEAGFVTDFASIPSAVQHLIAKNGPWDVPAVVHDWIYKHAGQVYVLKTDERLHGLELTRKQADDLMLAIMVFTETELWRRQAIHKSVRLFGQQFWGSSVHYKKLKEHEELYKKFGVTEL